MLYTTALSYHAELGVMHFVSAKTMGVAAIILLSEKIFSFDGNTEKPKQFFLTSIALPY